MIPSNTFLYGTMGRPIVFSGFSFGKIFLISLQRSSGMRIIVLNNLYEVPEDVLHKEGIEFLPTTLKDALDHFEADEVVRGALGAEYAEMYIPR